MAAMALAFVPSRPGCPHHGCGMARRAQRAQRAHRRGAAPSGRGLALGLATVATAAARKSGRAGGPKIEKFQMISDVLVYFLDVSGCFFWMILKL